ncbi:MAG: alanine dehydrogenase [Nitrospirae bacterium]|nr:alanine dehydrogenase [Nitrospirota bacterium]
MIIAVPKEIKDHEYRVSMTPEAAGTVVRSDHRVLVESGAGEGGGYSDQAYLAAGAKIVNDRARLFGEAELIVKVKEPLASEYPLFQKGQTLFTFLHLAADRSLTEALLEREIAAIAYETIQLPDGSLPVLKPMSAIAGRMSVLMGAFYLQKIHGGSGVLLPGIPGVPPARVVILGGGTVGTNAAQMAVGLSGQVTLFHRETDRIQNLEAAVGGKIVLRVSRPDLIEQAVLSADLVIGAVLVTGAKAPKLIGRHLVAGMRKGSVIIDVSVDQGGCIETSRPTTHSDPVYVVDGVIHYCVANMPGAFPRTATAALGNVTLPYILKVADEGVLKACRHDSALSKGLNVYQGKVTHPGVAEAHGMKYENPKFIGA